MLDLKTIIDPKINALYKAGRFVEAQDLLLIQFPFSLEQKKFEEALEYFKMLVRIHIEHESLTELESLFTEVTRNELFGEFCKKQPKFFYCQALLEFSKTELDKALGHIERSVQLALAKNDLQELTQALLAQVKISTNKKPLNGPFLYSLMQKIEMILEQTNDPDLWVLFHLQDCELALFEGKHDLSVEKAWLAYEKSKRSEFPQFYTVSVFAVLGYAYFSKKEFDKASIYLQIAKKSIEPSSMYRTGRIIDQMLNSCPKEETGYDLLLDLDEKRIKFKSKNEIDLKNQFILIDLMKLFFESKENAVSKNELVETIWKESYDPSRHDNLIYVTIKRLRNILREKENDDDVIVRSKKGYALKSGIVAIIK